MIINNLDLSNDNDFKLFSNVIVDDFIAYKIKFCKDISIMDSLMKYADYKQIEFELLGDCVNENITLKELLRKEVEKQQTPEKEFEW